MFLAYFLNCCKNLTLNSLPYLFILVQITVFVFLGMAAMVGTVEALVDIEDMEAMVGTVARGRLRPLLLLPLKLMLRLRPTGNLLFIHQSIDTKNKGRHKQSFSLTFLKSSGYGVSLHPISCLTT